MNFQEIKTRLENLQTDSKPLFGIMTAQHMLEHLTVTLKLSSGRIKLPEFEPTEKQLQQKYFLLETEMEFPKGIKAPGDTGTLPELRAPNLSTAKEKLIQSIEEYKTIFNEFPNLKTVHPRFGSLTKEEWEKFHSKHFKHHLLQFGV